MGYAKDVHIDINGLDKEWLRQAPLYQKYAKEAAEAQCLKEQAEAAFSLIQSQLDKSIRSDFTKYGCETKPTESAILSIIKGDKKYQEAQNECIDARYKARVLDGATKSMEHKKRALEKLTELYLSGYWAAPRIKSEAQEVLAEQANEQVAADLKEDPRMKELGEKKKAEKAEKPKKEKAPKKTKEKVPAAEKPKKKGRPPKKKEEPKPTSFVEKPPRKPVTRRRTRKAK